MFDLSIIFYDHNIEVFTKDSHISHKIRYIGCVLMDLPIGLKQPKGSKLKNMSKFT